MLVLSRKADEEIVIGEGKNQVIIAVIEVRGDKVRLGITADKSVPVHRREVWQAIQREARKELTYDQYVKECEKRFLPPMDKPIWATAMASLTDKPSP